MASRNIGVRQYEVAIRAMVVLTVILGVVYPLSMTAFAQVAFPAKANGSLVEVEGKTVGSTLIGQSFADATGAPLAIWFQSRPSAAGDGYDAGASSGSNLGPESAGLLTAVKERRAQVAEFNKVAPSEVPADAVTASASGLDPNISPEYARIQVNRVADARNLPRDSVAQLVERSVQARQWGYLGEPVVNVVTLNIALNALKS